MNAQEWETCTDPLDMRSYPNGVTPRKARLFCAALSRLVWRDLEKHPDFRDAIPKVEDHADGNFSEEKLTRLNARTKERVGPGWDARDVVETASETEWKPADLLGEMVYWSCKVDGLRGRAHCDVLRDTFGNPFDQLKLPVAGRGCPWVTPDVASLAEAAYEFRLEDGRLDPVRLGILADALEDAGCTDPKFVNPLRGMRPCRSCGGDHAGCGRCGNSPGWEASATPRFRGLHVLDLLLGLG